ncbi:HAMP domain-containing histidine kinase [archaeon]|nr:HAMP domain-containing histidine kinase [archaeon]
MAETKGLNGDIKPALTCLTCRYIFHYAKKNEIYDELIDRFVKLHPEYGEQYLLNTRKWIPQDVFYDLLGLYKELTGEKDPQKFAELGEILPTITSDSLVKFAQLLAGPNIVIKLSPSFSRRLNNDQEIEVKKIATQKNDAGRKTVRALIYHYNYRNQNPYLEMVEAALGYWTGVPSIWGFEEKGKVEQYASQFSLERLIEYDYKFLNLSWGTENSKFLINGDIYGESSRLFGDEKSYNPRLLLLDERKKEEIIESIEKNGDAKENIEKHFTPFIMLRDFIAIVNGEERIIFHKGRIYGNPCSVYSIEVPLPSFLERIGFLIRNANPFMLKRKHKQVLEETLDANRAAFGERFREMLEKERAKQELTRLRQILEGKTRELYSFFKSYDEMLFHINEGGHDAKGSFRRIGYNIKKLMKSGQFPEDITTLLGGIEQEADNGIFLADKVMKERLPLRLERADYHSFIEGLYQRYGSFYPGISWKISIDEMIEVPIDRDKFSTALMNILENSIDAMNEPDATGKMLVISTSIEEKKPALIEQRSPDFQRLQKEIPVPYLVTHILDQGGEVSEEVVDELNLGSKIESKKPKGTGIGSGVAYRIIELHKGKIEYTAREGGGMEIKIFLPLAEKESKEERIDANA